MGFFSEIVSETRRNQLRQTPAAPVPSAPKPAPVLQPASPTPAPASALSTDGGRPGIPVQAAPQAVPTPEPKPKPQPKPPAIDLTPGVPAQDDDAKRKAHEAAEAKRKAEFDARQAKKKASRQEQLDRISTMDDAALLAAAADRVSTETERLTRRNMKEAVAEHIQNKCREDAALARLVMDPAKSMVNCFQYINRKARKYAEQEMKDEGIQRTGVYGLDVPDGLVYQWAEEYFRDENAKEDHENDEKFVPKPYVSASPNRKKTQGKAAKKPDPAKKPKEAGPADTGMDQLSLI